MDHPKIVYTAHASATGGRDGRAVSSDGVVDVKLSVPKEMGGAGGEATNPEQLFAAGYSACFLGAVKAVARKAGVKISDDAKVAADVGIGPIPHRFRDQGRFDGDAARHRTFRGAEACRRRPHRVPLFERDTQQRCRHDQGRLNPRRLRSPAHHLNLPS